MVSSNHFLLFVQLFAVISTSSPDCVEPHAPGTPNGTCPPQPEPSRCCPEPLQPPVPVTPYAATKPIASTSSSHPENYKYSQPCTARLSGQWNGAAATMVSSNHFLLFVQLFAVISTSSPDCVEPHAPGTPNGTCPPQPEPSRCCPEPLQPPVPVTPYAATKPIASTSSSHPENYKYSQPCTARLSGQWNGAAATMVSSNHFLLFVQLFAVISTSSPDCVEPHAPGTPNGTCPPQPEPSRCCPEPLQPPVPVTPYAATKPIASTSSSHPENYKYSQPCTARLSGQWNGAAATMVSSNHFLLFVQLFAVISTSSPDCVEPHAPGTPNGTCPPQPEPSRCCPEPLQPPVPVTPYAATKPIASTSSSHPENYKYSQPCTARLSGQWNGAAATMVSSNHFLLFVQVASALASATGQTTFRQTPTGFC
ncbi:hypothetical protein MRX96_006686 [Rhipicephalus microplus]